MARPAKATVDYFPHLVTSGRTIFILESSFGNDGYAFWFKLLELLGSTEGHAYDCSDVFSWRYLVAKTRVVEEKAEQIMSMLAELDAIDGRLWREHRVVWSQNLVDNLADAYRGRKCPLPQKPEFPAEKPLAGEVSGGETPDMRTRGDVSCTENPQIKLDKTKLEESKQDTSSDDDVTDAETPPTGEVKHGQDSPEFLLAVRLRKRILDNKPDAKVPKDTPGALEKWSAEVDRLIRLDGRSPTQIRAVIDWCQSDPFWLGNILSPSSLRKHWDKLVLQMQRGGANRGNAQRAAASGRYSEYDKH